MAEEEDALITKVSVGLGDRSHDHVVLRAATFVDGGSCEIKNRTMMFDLCDMALFAMFLQLLPDNTVKTIRWVNANADA